MALLLTRTWKKLMRVWPPKMIALIRALPEMNQKFGPSLFLFILAFILSVSFFLLFYIFYVAFHLYHYFHCWTSYALRGNFWFSCTPCWWPTSCRTTSPVKALQTTRSPPAAEGHNYMIPSKKKIPRSIFGSVAKPHGRSYNLGGVLFCICAENFARKKILPAGGPKK